MKFLVSALFLFGCGSKGSHPVDTDSEKTDSESPKDSSVPIDTSDSEDTQKPEEESPTLEEKCADLDQFIEAVESPASAPPHYGTVWFSRQILTSEDPSAFVDLSYSGQDIRTMYDRRTASFESFNAHLYDAQFGSQVQVEIQVNPEFSETEAETQARFYAEEIGRLPAFLFRDLETVWIHRGNENYGGGNKNLLIHTGRTPEYVADGVLGEVFIHEAAHTSMDSYHAADRHWIAAQEADQMAISQYALEHPGREDIAESLGPYLGYRFRPDRLRPRRLKEVEETIPNRVLFLDCLTLSMDILQ